METVKTMVGRELDNLRKLLPTVSTALIIINDSIEFFYTRFLMQDKKDVFKKLETVIGECMETYKWLTQLEPQPISIQKRFYISIRWINK